jgi:hypothetical protein
MSSATTFGVEDLMKLHRGFIQRGEGRRLGKIVKIVLGEVPRDVPMKLSREELSREGRTLDWFDQGPLLGLSPGDVDLLVTSPVLPLPDKPDPAWQAPEATQQAIEAAVKTTGKWRPERAPLIKQIPEDRGARRLRGTHTLLFEPVHQVLFRPVGVNVFGCVTGIVDRNLGTHLTFVWDFDTGSGYFYGGRFMVKI